MTSAEQILSLGIRNEAGCLIWPRTLQSQGYGCIWIDGKSQLIHRVMHTLVIGPIPDLFQVDHTCHKPDTCPMPGIHCPHRPCFDPTHLEAVTPRVNVLRATRDVCDSGHRYTRGNTRIRRNGTRICIKCAERNYNGQVVGFGKPGRPSKAARLALAGRMTADPSP